jgi:predicted permease
MTASPGIKSAGVVSILPLAPKSISFVHFTRPDQPPTKPENTPSTNYRVISPDYFRAMGIPLLAGRYFTEEDNGDRFPVVIVSSVLAKNQFPDRSPVGQRIVIDDNDAAPRSVEIVGVVGPVKQANLETPPRADMYLPLRQVHQDGVPWLRNSIYCVAKINPQVGGVTYHAGQLRAAIRNVDPGIAVGNVRPMNEVLATALASRRFSLLLVGSFAGAALFLAAAGLYGVISYGIHQRTREIGVRLALGATRGRILRMILREGVLLLAAGITAGLVIALMMAKLVANQMYGVSERDPFSFAVVSLVLAAISLLACGIASRRAMNVDPAIALRSE